MICLGRGKKLEKKRLTNKTQRNGEHVFFSLIPSRRERYEDFWDEHILQGQYPNNTCFLIFSLLSRNEPFPNSIAKYVQISLSSFSHQKKTLHHWVHAVYHQLGQSPPPPTFISPGTSLRDENPGENATKQQLARIASLQLVFDFSVLGSCISRKKYRSHAPSLASSTVALCVYVHIICMFSRDSSLQAICRCRKIACEMLHGMNQGIDILACAYMVVHLRGIEGESSE